MRIARRSLAVFLALLFVAPAAHGQSHVVDRSALAAAIQERVSHDQADRHAILSLLQRDEVREIAARAGVSLEQVRAAVSTLDGEELEELASQARDVENDLAGGASTVVISTTTIIIVLLLVILILVLAD